MIIVFSSISTKLGFVVFVSSGRILMPAPVLSPPHSPIPVSFPKPFNVLKATKHNPVNSRFIFKDLGQLKDVE